MRRFKPKLTISGLAGVLTVAAHKEALGLQRYAELTGTDYKTAVIQAALLSDGRGRQPGANLLRRVSGSDRRSKALVLSRAGRIVAGMFVDAVRSYETKNSEVIETKLLPALHVLLKHAPDMNLTAFCVFLFIIQNNEKFGYDHEPASIISEQLDLTNLTRNLSRLANGEKGKSWGLIEVVQSRVDGRKTHPLLSTTGLTLAANLASRLAGHDVGIVKRAKAQSLNRAKSPEDVKFFSDSDFEIVDIKKE